MTPSELREFREKMRTAVFVEIVALEQKIKIEVVSNQVVLAAVERDKTHARKAVSRSLHAIDTTYRYRDFLDIEGYETLKRDFDQFAMGWALINRKVQSGGQIESYAFQKLQPFYDLTARWSRKLFFRGMFSKEAKDKLKGAGAALLVSAATFAADEAAESLKKEDQQPAQHQTQPTQPAPAPSQAKENPVPPAPSPKSDESTKSE